MKKKISCILLSIMMMVLLFETNTVYASETYAKVVVGDSRIVGLAACDGVKANGKTVKGANEDKSIYYYAKVGIGYNWLKENVDEIAKKCNNRTSLYVALGVNDLGNINRYKSLYDELHEKCNNAKVYIVKVGAVDEEKEKRFGYKIKQSSVDDFNSKLNKNSKDYDVINYFWPKNTGRNTTDGIHYRTCVYKDVLKKIKGNG